MNSTNLPTLPTTRRSKLATTASHDAFRQPAYECQEHTATMKLVVYVPGVDASAVEIEGRGADLTITAKKARFVRVNFGALHLESAQRDYRLRLRLGTGFDFAAMEAEIASGVLTITLPKRVPNVNRLRPLQKAA
jgi:HSP20 family protein